MKIVISGLGVMGASLALAIKNNLDDCVVWGYDYPAVRSEARQRGLIDREAGQWPADCADADIIFLATPIAVIRQHVEQLNGIVGADTVVTDLGSTKKEIEDYCRSIAFSGCYIGGHPMTGAEKNGLDAANPLLYENAVYILTDSVMAAASPARKKLIPLLEKIKARVFILPAADHDRVMAYISHLPQLIAIALVNTVGKCDDGELPFFELAAGGFRDLTRIASSSISIWQDILNSNQKNVKEALELFITFLNEEKERLSSLEGPFAAANRYRKQIPRQNKGFLSPLTDIMVYVNDRSGVIAKISNALFEHDIDIRDIELLKIREKEGGVFRLSFDSMEKAMQAIDVLEEYQFKAFVKE